MEKYGIALVVLLGSTAALHAAQDYCGRIKSLPDGYVVMTKKGQIFFAGDNSIPPDPTDVYSYLNAHHSDRDRGCYCISGAVENKRFTSVSSLTKCGGGSVR